MPPLLSSQMKLGAPDGAAEAPPPGIGAELASRAQLYVDEDPDGVTYRRYKGYEPLIEALRDKGVGDADMQSRADVWGVGVPGTESWDYGKVYDLARRHGVGDLKKDRAEFEAGVAARPGYQQRRAQVERGGRWWLELPLGVVQSFQPEYGPLPALGLPSKTILGAAAREAAINTLFEGVEIARTKQARDTLGNPITVSEGVSRLGVAAAGGALFGGGARAVPGGIDAARTRFETLIANNWDKLPAPLREKWGSAANVDGAALPDVFEAIVGRDNMSLDEKGAVALLRREAEIEAANPFRPDGAGVAAHNAAVARHVERIAAEIQGMRAPRTVAAAANDSSAMASGTVRAPTGGARSAIKAKIGRAESPSDTAKNPRSSATGRYQFVSGTWLSYYKRRYGSQGLTDAQILAKRTDGNVQDVLMDDLLADNARFLSSEGQPETAGNLYLTHFAGQGGARKLFRADPRASAADVLGTEVVRANPFLKGMTASDVIAWAARKMDEAPSAVGGVGRAADDGIDPEAAVRADLESRGAQLEAERASLDAQNAARAGGDDMTIEAGRLGDDIAAASAPPMPELQRELFPDEASWRIAQAAVDAEAMGLPVPTVTRQDIFAEERAAVAAAQALPGAKPLEVGAPGTEKYGRIEAAARDDEGMLLVYHPNDRAVAPSYMWMEIDDAGVATISIDGIDALSAAGNGRAAPGANRFGAPALREAADQVKRLFPDVVEVRGERLTGAGAGRLQSVKLADRGGLTAAEREAVDYADAGLSLYDEAGGEGAKLDAEAIRHDLRGAIDREELAGLSFAARDGADETVEQVLKDIDAEEAALTALQACL